MKQKGYNIDILQNEGLLHCSVRKDESPERLCKTSQNYISFCCDMR